MEAYLGNRSKCEGKYYRAELKGGNIRKRKGGGLYSVSSHLSIFQIFFYVNNRLCFEIYGNR